MASQPFYRYELIKLADKLNRDYYPLTELLCRNAKVQAEWLRDNNREVSGYVRLCAELSEHIAHHLTMTRGLITECREQKMRAAILNNTFFRQSREAITNTLAAIREQNTMEKIKEWKEMHENLRLQLVVLDNLLIELFRIEDADLLPLLEKNIPLN